MATGLISLSTARARYGLSVSTLRRKIAAGQLRAVRYTEHGKVFVSAHDIEQLQIAVTSTFPTDDLDALLAQIDAKFGLRPRQKPIVRSRGTEAGATGKD
jgi:hypothetical protein